MSSANPFAALPTLMADMAEVIADATGDNQIATRSVLKIMQAKGGQRVCISKTVGENDWLIQAVGYDIAAILLPVYASKERYDIPMGPTGTYNSQASARRSVIEAGLAAGMSINEVAQKAQVTRRMVFWVKARLMKGKKDKRQLSLFDDAAA